MDDTPDDALPEPGHSGESHGNVPTPRGVVPPPRSGQGWEKRGSSVLVPFIDRGDAGPRRQMGSRLDQFFAYSSHAALAALLFGLAWMAGSHFSGDHSLFDTQTAPPAQTQRETAERAEMLRATQKMSEDIRILKSNVEVLRASLAQTHAANKEASALDALKARIDAVKTGTNASIAELSSKVEHMQREPAAKLAQVIERLDRIERQTAAPVAAAPPGNAPIAAKTTVGKPAQTAIAQTKSDDGASEPKGPQLITDWVVRDVYDGIALVENSRGAIEVMPGETIPGAGTVKSIQRRGGGWIVITSRGLVDTARDSFQP